MERGARAGTTRLAQLLSLLLMLFASPAAHSPLTAQTVSAASSVRRTAPNFSRMDLSHKKIELTSYRKKVVLLNFWATWCAPCLTEMPTFIAWQTQYGSENFQVIGVSMDDAAPEVSATVTKLKLNYPVLMGDEHLGAVYGGVLGLPVTFLIDREGKIHARYQGAADLTRINDDIQSLLKSR
jgi:cytochrome c biogenesis protein CcmG/thiol:disulfide interchange protein DsbE